MIRKLIAIFTLAAAVMLGAPAIAGAVPVQGTDAAGWVLGALCTYHTNQDFSPNGTTHVNVDAYQRSDRPFRPECNRGNVIEATVLTSQMGFQFSGGDFFTCATEVGGANNVKRHEGYGTGDIVGSPFGSVFASGVFRTITGYIEPGHTPFTYGTLAAYSGDLKIRDAATSKAPGWNGINNCLSLDMK